MMRVSRLTAGCSCYMYTVLFAEAKGWDGYLGSVNDNTPLDAR